MGVGAVFLLIVLLVVLLLLGGAVYAIAARLRTRQLDPREDRVEGSGAPGGEDRGREPGRPLSEPSEEAHRRSSRPGHVRVDSEQRTRFIGNR